MDADPADAGAAGAGRRLVRPARHRVPRAVLHADRRALGRKRFGEERHYVVKFSSWNVRRLDLLRAAFPNTPWIFVYRQPVEVIGSILKGSPGWMQLQRFPTQAEHLLGIPADDCAAL